ncbi:MULTISPECIES: DUF2269 domain-containing protein [Cytobacillus]|uniref:DUF2269 domain-containing protein n=1 Tax=Cytobacillus TaxID=2675230 RepID=UPI002040E01B|nr:DUF2269 domain-containing protein [Cytobacillus firmus]MCM3706012.1 DUF2269 domain-containing protein [Cytobacillus firmus]
MSKDAGIFLGTSLMLILLIFIPIWIGKKRSNKLNKKQKNWWLISHVFFVVIFIGGSLGITLLAISTNFITEREHIYAAHLFIGFFDWFLIIPGGLGSFFTGIWLAARTHWGVTKYYWIMAKLCVTFITILFGSMYMRVWIHDKAGDVFVNSIHPLKNPLYLHSREMLFIGIVISFVFIIFLVVISYLKPWGKIKKAEKGIS